MVDRGRFQELASLLAEINAPAREDRQTYDSVLEAMRAEKEADGSGSAAGSAEADEKEDSDADG